MKLDDEVNDTSGGQMSDGPILNSSGGIGVREWRIRLCYLVCAVPVMALGLASRRYGMDLPVFVAEYAGDTLWGLIVFLGVSVVATGSRLSHRVGIAIAFAFAVEVSQLYHAPWIDTLRNTTLGGLVLGSGFVWTDFVCYATGVSFGAVIEHIVRSSKRTDSRNVSAEARDR